MPGRHVADPGVVPAPEELTPWECESLLRAEVVGRVGIATEDGPYVLPVNYSVVDGAIWIRTGAAGLLGRVSPGTVLALEVDRLDHHRRRGWSVLARGPAEPVHDPAVVARVDRVQPPAPWAYGDRPVHVRLRWSELTGRRLGTDWDLHRRPDDRGP